VKCAFERRIEKSAVSENFIEASREKVKQPMERPLGELRLCALPIDGTPFKDARCWWPWVSPAAEEHKADKPGQEHV
jgi:hypothetical protein